MHKIHSEVPWLNRQTSAFLFIAQHIFSWNWLEDLRKKNSESALAQIKLNLSQKNLSTGELIQIDRIEDLSEADFVQNYLNKNLPVIFSGVAKNWACTQKWGFDFLKNELGDVILPIIESTGLVEKEMDPSQGKHEPVLVEETTARNFVNDLRNGAQRYLRFSLILENYPELIKDFDNAWLKKMGKCFLGVGYQTFIGPAKRITPLHAGPTAFLYVMVDGEKKWTLMSAHSSALLNPKPAGRVYNFTDVDIKNPNVHEYPGFNLLSKFQFILKKGDVLFVPAWMWHEVENVTDSWGMSYRVTSLRCFLRYPSLVFVRLFLTKPFFFSNFINTFLLKKRTWAKLE